MGFYSELLAHLSQGESFAFFEEWTAGHRDWVALLQDAGAFLPEDEAYWALAASMGDYDPVPALRSLTIPLLAVFGSRDTGVPVEESLSILRRTVPAPLLRTAIIPGGDHRMQLQHSGDFAPGYPEELLAFIGTQQ